MVCVLLTIVEIGFLTIEISSPDQRKKLVDNCTPDQRGVIVGFGLLTIEM